MNGIFESYSMSVIRSTEKADLCRLCLQVYTAHTQRAIPVVRLVSWHAIRYLSQVYITQVRFCLPIMLLCVARLFVCAEIYLPRVSRSSINSISRPTGCVTRGSYPGYRTHPRQQMGVTHGTVHSNASVMFITAAGYVVSCL